MVGDIVDYKEYRRRISPPFEFSFLVRRYRFRIFVVSLNQETKNPLASGIVRPGSHLRRSGGGPARDRTLFSLVGGEKANCSVIIASPPPPPTGALVFHNLNVSHSAATTSQMAPDLTPAVDVKCCHSAVPRLHSWRCSHHQNGYIFPSSYSSLNGTISSVLQYAITTVLTVADTSRDTGYYVHLKQFDTSPLNVLITTVYRFAELQDDPVNVHIGNFEINTKLWIKRENRKAQASAKINEQLRGGGKASGSGSVERNEAKKRQKVTQIINSSKINVPAPLRELFVDSRINARRKRKSYGEGERRKQSGVGRKVNAGEMERLNFKDRHRRKAGSASGSNTTCRQSVGKVSAYCRPDNSAVGNCRFNARRQPSDNGMNPYFHRAASGIRQLADIIWPEFVGYLLAARFRPVFFVLDGQLYCYIKILAEILMFSKLLTSQNFNLRTVLKVNEIEQCRNAKAGRNWRSSSKPADLRHRSARFPLAKIRFAIEGAEQAKRRAHARVRDRAALQGWEGHDEVAVRARQDKSNTKRMDQLPQSIPELYEEDVDNSTQQRNTDVVIASSPHAISRDYTKTKQQPHNQRKCKKHRDGLQHLRVSRTLQAIAYVRTPPALLHGTHRWLTVHERCSMYLYRGLDGEMQRGQPRPSYGNLISLMPFNVYLPNCEGRGGEWKGVRGSDPFEGYPHAQPRKWDLAISFSPANALGFRRAGERKYSMIQCRSSICEFKEVALTLSNSTRKKLESASLLKTVETVRNKEMGFLKVSQAFGVPRSTLENYVNYKTIQDAELAARNNTKHPFSEDKGAAGKKWLKNFLRRHLSLPLSKPQAISAARAKCFCKEKVGEFYAVLDKSLQLVNFSPSKIFNVNETGLAVVQHNCSKVVDLKGKKQATSLSSAERGDLVILVTCMSASGRYIPPMRVFPRKNMKAELLQDAPPQIPLLCAILPAGFSKNFSLSGSFISSQLTHEDSTSLCTSVGPLSPTQANPSTASASKVFPSPTDISPPPLMKKPATSTARATRLGKAALITSHHIKGNLRNSKGRYKIPVAREVIMTTKTTMLNAFTAMASFPQDKKGEEWVRYSECFKWCYDQCAQVIRWKNFICQNCTDD
ncbi:hypothetical protein PR048_014342 [Dryococelus australis]|uniref:HTH psq-type domain-containing protein n=1 Tax=Dryococelus australis TaxID=614101 RepID=A0ABQ9HEC9_9NEOP|nr:hypothetical protein PR048_014342 [Dryococelus australis]